MSRVFWFWYRLWCVFGFHAYGYSRPHDAVLCFQCGRLAPLSVWRELYPERPFGKGVLVDMFERDARAADDVA